MAQSLRRAALELEKASAAVEALPKRVQRRLLRAGAPSYVLDPALLLNEAERARDTLHIHGLLDL